MCLSVCEHVCERVAGSPDRTCTTSAVLRKLFVTLSKPSPPVSAEPGVMAPLCDRGRRWATLENQSRGEGGRMARPHTQQAGPHCRWGWRMATLPLCFSSICSVIPLIGIAPSSSSSSLTPIFYQLLSVSTSSTASIRRRMLFFFFFFLPPSPLYISR